MEVSRCCQRERRAICDGTPPRCCSPTRSTPTNSSEGDPLKLAENRTITFNRRKLVFGSSPKFEETSLICRLYAESDQRVFRSAVPIVRRVHRDHVAAHRMGTRPA